MKAIPLALTANVGTSYDQTRTTLLGRAAKKTLSALQGGKTVVGTPLVAFGDVITDSGIAPFRMCVSDNGHELHFIAIPASGLGSIALYNVDEITGAKTYVGKLNFQLPVTNHTTRGVRLLNDSGASGWRILISTIGTSAALGGLFSLENVALSDFVSVPATLILATAPGQKAVYWHQEPGGTNNLTVSQGMGVETDAGIVGTKIIVANGLVAAPNFYTFDMANAITSVTAGVTTDWYVTKTGTITGLTGVFLLLNNYSICVPDVSSGVPLPLQGQTCLFVPGTTGFGLGKISELTSGATTWPSYTTADTNDVAQTNVAQTPATAHFSQVLQRIVFQLNASKWIVKKFVNAQYELVFGCSSDPQYRTAQPVPFYEFGGTTINSTFVHGGWLYTANATAGQIGALAFDLRSLWQYDYSAIISKVIDVNSQWVSLALNTPIRSFGKFFYRTSGFGSAAGGWIAVPEDRVLTGISTTAFTQVQFKFQPRMERDSVTIPVQIIEAYLLTSPLNEISDNWEGSVDNTATGSPSRTAFRLIKSYVGAVPKLYFRAVDDSSNVVQTANTVDNAAFFEYTTDNGLTWNPLGTIPNTPLTTEIRYNWATPPGVKVTVSLRES